MKVRELIAALQALDPELLVIMSSDSEGNNYSPLAGAYAEDEWYVADSTWSGEVWYDEVRRAEGIPDDKAVPCVVLTPTN